MVSSRGAHLHRLCLQVLSGDMTCSDQIHPLPLARFIWRHSPTGWQNSILWCRRGQTLQSRWIRNLAGWLSWLMVLRWATSTRNEKHRSWSLRRVAPVTVRKSAEPSSNELKAITIAGPCGSKPCRSGHGKIVCSRWQLATLGIPAEKHRKNLSESQVTNWTNKQTSTKQKKHIVPPPPRLTFLVNLLSVLFIAFEDFAHQQGELDEVNKTLAASWWKFAGRLGGFTWAKTWFWKKALLGFHGSWCVSSSCVFFL